MKKKYRVYHPKCKELWGTIEEVKDVHDGGTCWHVINEMGWEDWTDTEEDAKADLDRSLESRYNGSAGDHEAEERSYAAAERFYTTGG